MVEPDVDWTDCRDRVDELLRNAGMGLLRLARAAMFDGTPYAAIYIHVFGRQ